MEGRKRRGRTMDGHRRMQMGKLKWMNGWIGGRGKGKLAGPAEKGLGVGEGEGRGGAIGVGLESEEDPSPCLFTRQLPAGEKARSKARELREYRGIG